MGLIIEIPQFTGKLEVPLNTPQFHVGKQEFKDSLAVLPKDDKAFEPISSVRKDNAGNITKEQFIIRYQNGQYTIEDRGSTNGTYIGSLNLKGKPPTKIQNGMEIVIPIQENNQLVQMKIIFKIVPDTQITSNNVNAYHSPQYTSPGGNVATSAPQYNAPVYNDPALRSSAGASAPMGASSVPIPGGYQNTPSHSSNAAQYYDPSQSQLGLDSNQSFIVKSQMVNIPANAFSPDSGLDLSFVYQLEKSEMWHIMVALLLLMAMIARTAINMLIIELLISYITWADLGREILMFLPLIFIFPLSFLIHELAHLNMGKHFGYQSRFCLTKVGLATTKKAIIIGLPFGLPGAAVSVGVDPARDQRQMGFIKTAGPASNFIIGVLLFIIAWVIPITGPIPFTLKTGILQGASLNIVLGLFNMIPVSIKGFALDGQYIVTWNKKLYLILIFALAIMLIFIFLSLNAFGLQYQEWMKEQYSAGLLG
jgi:Zn-dependent protease